jgi:hypothetical protein
MPSSSWSNRSPATSAHWPAPMQADVSVLILNVILLPAFAYVCKTLGALASLNHGCGRQIMDNSLT